VFINRLRLMAPLSASTACDHGRLERCKTSGCLYRRLEKCTGRPNSAPTKLFAEHSGFRVINVRQIFDLLDVENGLSLENRDFPVDFGAGRFVSVMLSALTTSEPFSPLRI
jgi:hypothetical protein